MHDTQLDPVDVGQMIAWIADGETPDGQQKIGTEHEKFLFHRQTLAPVAYEGEAGIGVLLERLLTDLGPGAEPIMENGTIIGIVDADGGAVTLEPGGQLELSGAPLDDIHQTCSETGRHLRHMLAAAKPLDIGMMGLGYHPVARREDISFMPKGRYRIMSRHMPKVGTLGLDMMLRTCTVQVNLDFADEADMVKKLRVALALQPIATALFANSPFADGKPNGFLSYRSHIWTDTDAARTGTLPFAFEDGFGFERYVDWALDAPMYLVVRDGRLINAAGESFRDFLDGKLPQLPGQTPNIGDWETHLSTLFPEVRLKTFLEMRGADSGPWCRLCALPAFWVGLLYDSASLDAAWDLVKDWTAEERETMRMEAARTALKTPFRGRTLQDIAKQALDISRQGLSRRERLNAHGENESLFLDEIQEIADSGVTPAETLLDSYYKEWGEDVDPVFEKLAY